MKVCTQGCPQECTPHPTGWSRHSGQSVSHTAAGEQWVPLLAGSPRISPFSASHLDRPMKLLAKIVFAFVFALLIGSAHCFARDIDPDTKLIVQDIQCRGNVSTACSFIRGHLYLAAGEQLNEGQVEDAKLRLSALPNFKSVDIHLEKGSQKGSVIVVIEVAEASPFSSALVLGTSFRDGTDMQMLAARISDHNLWGAGKTVDLLLVADLPINHRASKDFASRLEYFDPQLFGSNRYFLATGLFYSRSTFNFSGGDLSSGGDGGVDLSLGRRFGSFSYVTAGFRYLFNPAVNSRDLSADKRNRYLAFDGNLTTLTDSSGSRVLLFTYGRNSEDDPVFPTRGWMFHIYDDWAPREHVHFAGAEARVTWRSGGNSFWTAQTRPFNDFNAPFDDDLGTSVTYARSINSSGFFSGIQRGRWYVGPGITVIAHNRFEVGVKAGIRLETRSFGLVNLYVIGSHINGPYTR